MQRKFQDAVLSVDSRSTREVPNIIEKHDPNKVIRIKKRADRAFSEGNFEKAYELYNQALIYEPNDYDLTACLVGAALNLGLIDEVFEKSNYLIGLDEHKAQGYYLKGIAYDVIFKFDQAIELFLKSLEYEKEHANIIIRNLLKTIIKYSNKDDSSQLEEPEYDENEINNLLKLIEVTDLLVRRRRGDLALKVLNYIQSLDIENYNIKTELLMMMGKIFKFEKNYDKALLAFEECHYLSNSNDDYKLKIKTIVSISSCYLDMSDLHKVIYYYHKLIDLESYLLKENKSLPSPDNFFDESLINIELRVAIRQNLFTAHYRLGKLRVCTYYLSEIIDIIDKSLSLNDVDRFGMSTLTSSNHHINTTLFESFEFIQIKIDASIELIKIFILFDDFLKMKSVLDSMLKFVENIIEKEYFENTLNDKQLNSLRYFKIKCYSYLGICLAGLRDYRYSKLCTRKCLILIEKEFNNINSVSRPVSNEQNTSISNDSGSYVTIENSSGTSTRTNYHNDLKFLTLLKIECLIDASEACKLFIKTFNEMKNHYDHFYADSSSKADPYNQEEIDNLLDVYSKRIEFAKLSYNLSKTLIDPNLRAQTTFNLALSLYDNQYYQSAAYYFNEVLSISTILLENKTNNALQNNSGFYIDTSPVYHLESNVYFCKCLLQIHFYKLDSCLKNENELSGDDSQEARFKFEKIDLESLKTKLIKSLKTVTKHALKWKLNETSRNSYLIDIENSDKLKYDEESKSLRTLLKLCSECLIYIFYELNMYSHCIIYSEYSNYLLNTGNDPNEIVNTSNLLDLDQLCINENEFNDESLKKLIKNLDQPVLMYEFIFDSRLLYIFMLNPTKSDQVAVGYANKIKLNQYLTMNQEDMPKKVKLVGSYLNIICRRLEIIHNEFVKVNLNEIEFRDVPTVYLELFQTRVKNRSKERNFYYYLNGKPETSYSNEQIIDMKISEKLVEESSSFNIEQTSISQFGSLEGIIELLSSVIIDPVKGKLSEYCADGKTLSVHVNNDGYVKSVVLMLNKFNQNNQEKLTYLVVLKSFVLYMHKIIESFKRDEADEKEISKARQTVLSEPNRYKKLDSNEMSIKIPKSNIKPRFTSHPRLAVNLLNQDPSSNYVVQRVDHVQRVKNRLDSSVSILISQTISGTDAKRSHLEVIDFKQVNNPERCCVIGCPEVPSKLQSSLKLNKFLINGFEQMKQISDLIYASPIFSDKMTKHELINQLETGTCIFLSTFSTNESDSMIICSESPEFPSSSNEFHKYCVLSVDDLNMLDMHRCKLLVLNCYSVFYNNPRYGLAQKFLSNGCKNVLVVLSPLPDKIMTQFFYLFFENLKKELEIPKSYEMALDRISQLANSADSTLVNNLISSSFCLLGTKSIKLCINKIGGSMVQTNVDKSLENIKFETGKNHLNIDSKPTVLSPNFTSSLEKTLNQLQILIKFLLNQLIESTNASNFFSFNKNSDFKTIFYSLNDLVSKAIYYMKSNKCIPEQLNEKLEDNPNVINLLECLGFGVQAANVTKLRDRREKKFIVFPEHRFLDLNVRMKHILASLIEICFSDDSNPQTDSLIPRIKMIIFCLQSLLPVDDKNLLSCLIDIIALTKFSPEITLSLSDYSIYYAFNFYENKNKPNSNRKLVHLIDKSLERWNNELNNDATPESNNSKQTDISPNDYKARFSITNRVVNFFMSLGFEIIGQWIRFNETEYNLRLLDLALKILSSFTLDRDMSLYKELNINVMGQRSAPTRSLIRTSSYLSKNDLKKPKEDVFKLQVTAPWCSLIETQDEMDRKMEFSDKFYNLSKKISAQRTDTLRHHLNYVLKQNKLNDLLDENLNKSINNRNQLPSSNNKDHEAPVKKINRIKYKPGGSPTKDRVIADEKLNLTLEQINIIRQYSHYFCKKNIEKIDVEFKEKVQKLMLPMIKNSNSVNY